MSRSGGKTRERIHVTHKINAVSPYTEIKWNEGDKDASTERSVHHNSPFLEVQPSNEISKKRSKDNGKDYKDDSNNTQEVAVKTEVIL